MRVRRSRLEPPSAERLGQKHGGAILGHSASFCKRHEHEFELASTRGHGGTRLHGQEPVPDPIKALRVKPKGPAYEIRHTRSDFVERGSQFGEALRSRSTMIALG